MSAWSRAEVGGEEIKEVRKVVGAGRRWPRVFNTQFRNLGPVVWVFASQSVVQRLSILVTRALARNAESGFTPDLGDHSLHFKRNPRRSVSSSKHCSRLRGSKKDLELGVT